MKVWKLRHKTAKSTVAPGGHVYFTSHRSTLKIVAPEFVKFALICNIFFYYDRLFILSCLLKDFPMSEEVWNLVARRAIDEANSQVKKGTAVITGLWFSSYNANIYNYQ